VGADDGNAAPSTRKDYATLLKKQVLPEFGDLTLAGIDVLAVREWVAELVANGLSAKRARKAHQVLSQILASAVDGGRLPRNVAEGIKLIAELAKDGRPEALATLARTSADQRSCLSGKVLVSARVRGCRRRGSNPHALWAQRF
jgi:hypothetical protein